MFHFHFTEYCCKHSINILPLYTCYLSAEGTIHHMQLSINKLLLDHRAALRSKRGVNTEVISRRALNPMNKGACNSGYYGQNSSMESSVTLYIYISLCTTRMYRMDHHFIMLCDKSEASFGEKATKTCIRKVQRSNFYIACVQWKATILSPFCLTLFP